MQQEEHMLYYLRRIQERLTIINISIRDGLEMSEEDTEIMKSVWLWYNRSEHHHLNKVIQESPIITQSVLFDGK